MTTLQAPPRHLVAGDVMTSPVISVGPFTTVWQAWSLMMRTGLRHLLVVSDEGCIGLVDDRQVFAEWPMGPLALHRHQVQQLMRPSVTCVLSDTDLSAVAAAMVRDNVDAVPVVEADGSVVGVVTGSDIARAVANYGIQTD